MAQYLECGLTKEASNRSVLSIDDLLAFDHYLKKRESNRNRGSGIAQDRGSNVGKKAPSTPGSLDLSSKGNIITIIDAGSNDRTGCGLAPDMKNFWDAMNDVSSYGELSPAVYVRNIAPATNDAEPKREAQTVTPHSRRSQDALQRHPDYSVSSSNSSSLAPVALSTAAILAHEVRLLAHPYLSGTTKESGCGSTSVAPLPLQLHPRHGAQRHHKAVSRTQSAPLPALSLMVQLPCHTLAEHQQLVKQHQEQFAKEQQKKLVIEQLRQTLLQRSSVRGHGGCSVRSQENSLQETSQVHDAGLLGNRTVLSNSEGPPLTSVALFPNYELQHSSFGHTTRPSEMRHVSRTRSSPLMTLGIEKLLPQQMSSSFAIQSHSAPASTHNTSPVEAILHSGKDVPQLLPARRTALAYDTVMLQHECTCRGASATHLENPDRIRSIWKQLENKGLLRKCHHIKSPKARLEHLQLCHSRSYSVLFGTRLLNHSLLKDTDKLRCQFVRLSCGGLGVDDDTIWNEEHSPEASVVAAGCVMELSSLVTAGAFCNGMAIVRPPGHHAEHGRAMGFCYFNSIAIAAKYVKEKYCLQKILIVDWDVHHGNGTQQATYDDPSILYVSLHRHDHGNFFPGTGAPEDCGDKCGLGFNVNIAFSSSHQEPMGDAEYMAAFRCLVIPIAQAFKPQLVLVSSGFDAADGHAAALGGYKLSPQCFGYMTRELMLLPSSRGKVVLVLEGGYNIRSMCEAAEMCVRSLLGEEVPPPPAAEMKRKPCDAAVRSLQRCADIQSRYWPTVLQHCSSIQMSQMEALQSIMLNAGKATFEDVTELKTEPSTAAPLPKTSLRRSARASYGASEPMEEI